MTTEEDKQKGPETPRRTSPAKRNNVTPNNRKASTPGGKTTPKSAPAAGAGRPRAATMKAQPTLLGDFLLGRQSPARIAADREAAKRKRQMQQMTLEQVKQEMREAAVRKVQSPGGVHDRVKQWQKKNQAEMATADPLIPPSEPSEVHIQVDTTSVTEEDRVRIKKGEKKKPSLRPIVVEQSHGGDDTEKENRGDSQSGSPPKKRVVSDTNWMKNKKNTPQRSQSPKTKATETTGSPLPKDFPTRSTPNPPVRNKIRDWAAKVEMPAEPQVKHYSASRSVGSSDGPRAKSARTDGDESSMRSSANSEPRTIVVETERKPRQPRAADDDGIRVKPIRDKKPADDGIRVRPQKSPLPSEGTSVRSGSRKEFEAASTVREPSRHSSPKERRSRRDDTPSNVIEVFEESESEMPDTPTRRSSRTKPSKMNRKPRAKSVAETGTTMTEDVSDSASWSSDSGSDIPSSIPPNLADIPVGFSAFSELDMPTGPPRRPKAATRNSSFKGATSVLKRAFTESKKLLHERVEPPPKPIANQPRSIESWLNKTVDPFVDEVSTTTTPEPTKAADKERAPEKKTRRSASASQLTTTELSTELTVDSRDEDSALTKDDEAREPERPKKPAKPTEPEETTPTPAALKRSRATRSASSPVKPGTKKGFKERLKEAFRGESSMASPTRADEAEPEPRRDEELRDRRRSSGSRSSPSSQSDDSTVSPEPKKSTSPVSYPKRKPPTKGVHELSTILSLESFSTGSSDLSSVVSDTTITQTTGFTRTTASGLSRHRSNKPGLKRRLTKHSDLVSVLSLADDTSKLGRSRSRSLKSTRSVRRTSNHLDTATVEGLLQEFASDEDLYRRELKTLVDGVIPVLLTQVVHDGSTREDLFASPSGRHSEDSMAKSVVHMGIALEKIRNAHKRCPLSDAHRLPQWLEATQSLYDNYLDVWRLGFSDLIVNLAPLSLDDNDSLVNALPRNEEGDVVNEDGERVDVAHLLKKPLVRVKWINKFIKGYRSVTGTDQYQSLANNWENLQEKTRRRHKEESARVVDEDAMNTDTSRVRDLRTLEALDNVRVDRYRQVYAKDLFSLDLQHTNGQRLECQVELISRDCQQFKSDPGDLLIRETGSAGRSWLLFAPILGGHWSARRGDKDGEMVVMIRGKDDEWFQLLTLTTDSEDQVMDWVDILGTKPLPPVVSETMSTVSQALTVQPRPVSEEAPLGERKSRKSPSSHTRNASDPENKVKTPSRNHHRTESGPELPTSFSVERDSHHKSRYEDAHDDEEDAPPPPPAHRVMPVKKSPSLSPPVDLGHGRIKRRGSLPLKHEYYPSDVSSDESTSTSESDYDDDFASESSDDELEAADIPDTVPAISIKRAPGAPHDSVISESELSLTPSASASQAGLPKFGRQTPEYAFQSTASISYWDNKKGCWKDLWPDLCSIVTSPGLIEAYPYRRTHSSSGETSQFEDERPLIALDLTPLVMLRNSTVLDLEIRSPVLSYARLYSKVTKIETSFFRFRAGSVLDCEQFYMAVHRARMDNAKYKALEEEARVRAFGQNQATETEGDGSSRHRGWFGRKNSYRASARAPSQSAGGTSHSSSVSASSFLKRLMGGGNNSFNIARSSIDKQSRPGSGEASLYGSSSSGSPRSPSVSAANSGNAAKMSLTTNNLKIRLHLMVSASKWEDHGNCLVEITRPDNGTRQQLRTYQGMEKRVIVTSIPKKDSDKPIVILDVVLGSRCFSRLGSRGILLNVWEEVRDESGSAGVAPKGGGSGGMVNKWCFQCASVVEASWIFGLVTQEVVIS